MMNMEFKRKLTIPADLKKEYPVTEEMRKRFLQRDEALKKILSGEDDRIVLVIGPCSADQEASVMDYVNRLRALQEKVADRILMIPRVHTNKPRTTGAGYKGILQSRCRPGYAQGADCHPGAAYAGAAGDGVLRRR